MRTFVLAACGVCGVEHVGILALLLLSISKYIQ